MPKIIVSDADGEREYGLTKDEIGIGRVSGQNDIVIKVSEASRRHCRVVKEDDAWFVEDLGSSNGTRVNGRKVTKFELQDGDEIQVGIARMRFLSSDVEDAPPISGSSDEIELEISLDDDACWLAFTNGPRAGERIPLQGRCTIGRRSTNTLVLEEKGVSGSHTEVHPENGGWRVRDAGSTNGTLVNGEKIVEADLEPGDIIKVGIVEFLFGTGDEVDLSAISATTQLETTGLDEEVFAISDRNFKRRRKTSLVLSLGLVAAIVGSAAWWITQGGSQSATRREPERISGNVIVKGASFELDQIGEDDYLTSDSDALDYQEVSKPVNSGVNALEVRAAGVEGSAYVEFLQPIENVNSADRFEIGAHLRASGLQGNAGVSLLWAAEDGRPLGTSDLIANPGGSGFQRLSGFVRPPEGAARARFGIGFHDASGKLYVDDVFLIRHRGEAGGDLLAHNFTVYLDSSAVVSIQRDGKDVVSQLGLGVFGQGRFRSLNRDYVPSEESRTKTRSESRGTFLATGSFEGGDYSLVAETTERGLKIAGQIASQDAAIRLGLAIDPTLGLVTVADGVAQRHLEDFEREGVTELVLGSGYRGMRIAFSEPTPVALLTDGGLSRVLLPLVAEGAERGFELQIQLDFAAEAGELTDLNTRASRAQVVDQNFGEAMRLYEEIVNRFSFRQDIADRAAEQLEVLRKAGEAKAELLSARADEMIFFKTFRTELSGLQRDVEQVATRYEGTTIAESLHQILDRARSAWEALAADERMELARNHLLRGQDLMRPGHVSPEAARAFFLSVQDLAPEGSELHDAAKSELARVASILGAN